MCSCSVARARHVDQRDIPTDWRTHGRAAQVWKVIGPWHRSTKGRPSSAPVAGCYKGWLRTFPDSAPPCLLSGPVHNKVSDWQTAGAVSPKLCSQAGTTSSAWRQSCGGPTSVTQASAKRLDSSHLPQLPTHRDSELVTVVLARGPSDSRQRCFEWPQYLRDQGTARSASVPTSTSRTDTKWWTRSRAWWKKWR